jgi:hypothetical protein
LTWGKYCKDAGLIKRNVNRWLSHINPLTGQKLIPPIPPVTPVEERIEELSDIMDKIFSKDARLGKQKGDILPLAGDIITGLKKLGLSKEVAQALTIEAMDDLPDSQDVTVLMTRALALRGSAILPLKTQQKAPAVKKAYLVRNIVARLKDLGWSKELAEKFAIQAMDALPDSHEHDAEQITAKAIEIRAISEAPAPVEKEGSGILKVVKSITAKVLNRKEGPAPDTKENEEIKIPFTPETEGPAPVTTESLEAEDKELEQEDEEMTQEELDAAYDKSDDVMQFLVNIGLEQTRDKLREIVYHYTELFEKYLEKCPGGEPVIPPEILDEVTECAQSVYEFLGLIETDFMPLFQVLDIAEPEEEEDPRDGEEPSQDREQVGPGAEPPEPEAPGGEN